MERVPPKKYGGTERIIYHLTEELVKRGHEVTLFASGDSQTSARLVPAVPRALRDMPEEKDVYGFNINSMLNIGRAYVMQDEFDVIHDHNPHMGLPTANLAHTPVVMTWHGPYGPDIRRYFTALPGPTLVSISNSQARLAEGLTFARTVYNGLPMGRYPFSGSPQEYLLFVGRIDREKGVHFAMDAAVRLGRRLVIAAKLDAGVPHIKQYFDSEIAPRLNAHPTLLKWVGEVDEGERNELMKNALCLLHPVTWPEPFGLVLIEAMACGTPVVAFNQGSIPEVVQHGKTGFVVEDVEGMVAAIRKIGDIDRGWCRQWALENFSVERMADGYEEVYRAAAMKRSVNELHMVGRARIPISKYARNDSRYY